MAQQGVFAGLRLGALGNPLFVVVLVVQIQGGVRQLLFDGLDLALFLAPHFPMLLGRRHGECRGRIAQLIGTPSGGRLDILEVELRLEAHCVLGEELQAAGRVEAQHDILEIGVDVAVAILAVEDLPLGGARIGGPGKIDVVQLDTAL